MEDGSRSAATVDVAGLQDALLDAEGLVEPAVEDVLGAGVSVYNKPGYVPGDVCAGRGHPGDGSTGPALLEVATATLVFLQSTI